jgi:hypothetical protein
MRGHPSFSSSASANSHVFLRTILGSVALRDRDLTALVTQQILSIFERYTRSTQPPAEGEFQIVNLSRA